MDFGIFFVFGGVVIYCFAMIVILLTARNARRRMVTLKRLVAGVGAASLICVWYYWAYHLDDGLMSAACGGDTAEVKRFLAKGANPNYYYKGFTPLGCASSNGHAETAKALREAGAKK